MKRNNSNSTKNIKRARITILIVAVALLVIIGSIVAAQNFQQAVRRYKLLAAREKVVMMIKKIAIQLIKKVMAA